ncbi:hypothetical protein [Aminobacter sp. MSH1]|uniref:hypothetical protein n=1 Tax=Aminobacter sp. MSH1 TaxID=374606 RepID=UPI00131EF0E8|nr:hypothetical protein [Aminobacter sp. MSH1]
MTEVARQYGLNALRLAKACDTHDIARPPAGYWQKLEHGKRVEMRALESDRFKPEDVVTVPKASIQT